jgi:hypothetical protein
VPTLEVKGQRFAIDTASADEVVRDGRAHIEIDVHASLDDASSLYEALIHSHLTRERLALKISGPGGRHVEVSPLFVETLAPAWNAGINYLYVEFRSL